MKIKCSTCSKAYDIPDKRLPGKKKFSFACPSCKAMISVDLTEAAEEKQARINPSPSSGKELPRGEALKKQILKKISSLPAMPQTVMKARSIMSSDSSGFKELAQVLETDQAIASRLLKLSNSAYYGMRGKISSLQHASVVLGLKTLKEIIMLAGSSSMLAGNLDGYGLEAGDLWQHSLGVAFGAKMIASQKCPDLAEDAFVAGLIHDCGKLVLDGPILERKEMFTSIMESGEQTFLKAEKTVLGFDHPEIAYALCKTWNVPETLIGAIRYHHAPARNMGDKMTAVIHVADALAMMSGLGAGIDGMAYELDAGAMKTLDLQEEDIPEMIEQIVDSVMKILDQQPESG